MDLKLKDKRALVTGSTAGIGLAIAKTLSREGAGVIVNGRSQNSVEKALAEIQTTATGPLSGFAGDLTSAAAADELFRMFPDVEILVNNLGIYEPRSFEEIADEDWRRFLR